MKSKLYEIVIPLFDDELNFRNLINNLKLHRVPMDNVIVIASGCIGGLKIYSKKEGFTLHESCKQLTPGDARNLGASFVAAEYIVFVDSDILVTRSWKAALDELTRAADKYIFGETYHMSTEPNWIELCWFERIRKLDRRYINGGNLIIKRKHFFELGGFDSNLETGEDYDICVRSEKLGYPCYFDNRLVVHHEGNPKSIRQFFRREQWHAKGDLKSIRAFFGSHVMIASLLYILLIILTFASILFFSPIYLVFSLVATFMFTALLTIYKFGWRVNSFAKTVLIMNIYLVGRSSAIIKNILF